MTLHDSRARASVDGHNRERLARCLAARGLVIAPDEIHGVSRSGARVDLTGDRASVWVLPRWIEEARAEMRRPSDARTPGFGRADSDSGADPVEPHTRPPHARANERQVMEHALRTMVRAHGVGDAILELSDCNRGVTDMRAVQLLEQIEAEESLT